MTRSILVLLAAGALAGAPAATAASTSRGETATGLRADGLRWQGVADAYGGAPVGTPAGLRADGLRWQAEARAYQAAAAHDDSTVAYLLIALGGLVVAASAFVLVRLRTRQVVPPVLAGGES